MQPVVHSCIETSLHQLGFFLEIYLRRIVSVLKISYIVIFRGAAHALAVNASSAHVCTDEWRPTAIRPPHSQPLYPLTVSLPRKKVQAISPSYA